MGSTGPLTNEILETVLYRIPNVSVGVLGDLFLDRYLDIESELTEPSLETGLDAYQVVAVRPIPGAAGTVINNLVALGVRRVVPIAVIGDDGEGYELLSLLQRMPAVELQGLAQSERRRTPTYTKPLLCRQGCPPQELNRLDIKNRRPLEAEVENKVIHLLGSLFSTCDAWVVLDQVSERDCGVVTARVRIQLQEIAAAQPSRFVLADSRELIGQFRGVAIKPNRDECVRAVFPPGTEGVRWREAARSLATRVGRPVFCTAGAEGTLVVGGPGAEVLVPAFPVQGPIDSVGAGDSTSAGIVCAIAAGADFAQAASFGNLVASVTIQQIGTTGTATPTQLRHRWAEVQHGESGQVSPTPFHGFPHAAE
jgi:bifunctional ADP-heptose synthase (sugar kinase/adenylyltransferase)